MTTSIHPSRRRAAAAPIAALLALAAASWAGAVGIELRPWNAMRPLLVGEPSETHLAIHFAASADAAEASRAKETTGRAPEVAGVRHVYVLPAMADGEMESGGRKAAWQGVEVFLDKAENGLAVRWKANAGDLVVLSPNGMELFRMPAKDGAPAPFEQFASRFERATSDGAAKNQNVDKAGLALQGYDPVSYFDGSAAKGRDGLSSRYQGATYRFASAQSRARFAANPAAFAPEYGGWCATAMAEGDKVEVDPERFKISNGRLFLFYNGFWGDALKTWNKDEPSLTAKADNAWDGLVDN